MATGLGNIRPSTGTLEERQMNLARLHTFARRDADATKSTSLHPVVGIEEGYSYPPTLVFEAVPRLGR
jgi:hypothetical protein